jgi:hypothetical protein
VAGLPAVDAGDLGVDLHPGDATTPSGGLRSRAGTPVRHALREAMWGARHDPTAPRRHSA